VGVDRIGLSRLTGDMQLMNLLMIEIGRKMTMETNHQAPIGLIQVEATEEMLIIINTKNGQTSLNTKIPQ
jgi:hypothetical protein